MSRQEIGYKQMVSDGLLWLTNICNAGVTIMTVSHSNHRYIIHQMVTSLFSGAHN